MSKNQDYTIELQEPPCKVSNDKVETDPRDRIRWHHVSPQGETLETDACIAFKTWPFTGRHEKIPFDRDANGQKGEGFTKWYTVKDASNEEHPYDEHCERCDEVTEKATVAGARIIIR